ncbi:MAG: rRNA (uracil1939-C5)-methyltransferase [Chloroflexota bacterium]|nr:rRNA (uracil1939-C5)-methyltransferase [Chloroflexota bacterium]
MVYEGSGFSRLPDGKAVFVPYVMPGEQVTIRVREDKKGFTLADLLSVERPHPQRIQPRCTHFGLCGGCHYQHIPYDLQLAYKKDILTEQLQRIGNIPEPNVAAAIPAPQPWSYRNTVQFQVSGKGQLCYAKASDNYPFAVKECFLPMPALAELWPQLSFEAGSYMGRLELRQNPAGEVLLELHDEQGELPELENESSVSIVSLAGDDAVVLAGDGYLVVEVLGRPFMLSAGSFFQTNFDGAALLVEQVRALVRELKPQRLLDVYSGVGLFSAFLAAEVEELLAIESSPSACRDFVVNLDEFDNVALAEGKAEKLLPQLDFDGDVVLVDPPRSGLRAQACEAILKQQPRAIIYVSCNPATLARDTRALVEGGYRLERATLVDMFPQTYHMETVALLSRV